MSATIHESVVLAMKCEHQHITLWPVDLTPWPSRCPCYAGEGVRCSTALHDTGARFERIAATPTVEPEQTMNELVAAHDGCLDCAADVDHSGPRTR